VRQEQQQLEMPDKLHVKTKKTCPQVTWIAMTKLFSRTLKFAGIDSQVKNLGSKPV